MRLVRCISERRLDPNQITVGKLYWIDDSSSYKDTDGDEYVLVYRDEFKTKLVGRLLTNHFETVHRYLNHGSSLSTYVNTKTPFLLKDIITWCLYNDDHVFSKYIIQYINDNNLFIPENLEKEFVVNHIPFKDFESKGKQIEYTKYMGYDLYCVS